MAQAVGGTQQLYGRACFCILSLCVCACVCVCMHIHKDVRPPSAASDKIFELSSTDGHLAMTDLIGSGWAALWQQGKMAVVPGVGRIDHGRSHFEVQDAAAKGVSVEKEKETQNGWLAKSIFGYNNLYCRPGETECPTPETFGPPNLDGISLANSAAGPNAMLASRSIMRERSFNHMTGVQSVDGILESDSYQFTNPFARMRDMMMDSEDTAEDEMPEMTRRSRAHSVSAPEPQAVPRARTSREEEFRLPKGSSKSASSVQSELERRRRNKGQEAGRRADRRRQRRSMTDTERWHDMEVNLGLEELLVKEETIFQALGVMKDKLGEYQINLASLCPATDEHAGFPGISEWADSESAADIGMQLRAVAILIVNGVAPRVFQVQQTLFDTHSNQGPRLKILLADLRTAVATFIRAAENCGFWNDVLLTTFSDFGRRLEENSRKVRIWRE